MPRYPELIIKEVRRLRSMGMTYAEIRKLVNLPIPKSSLSHICRYVELPQDYVEVIQKLNKHNLNKARLISAASRQLKRQRFHEDLKRINLPIAEKIKDRNTAKIALSMLCLGEASKSKSKTSFYLGSSDYRIIKLFLNLLKFCYEFKPEKVRCTVQCRADQDTDSLERYWQKVTAIPKENFYKSRIDPRTIGKPTVKAEYMGVLKVDYFDREIQLDLESLADLVYNRIL